MFFARYDKGAPYPKIGCCLCNCREYRAKNILEILLLLLYNLEPIPAIEIRKNFRRIALSAHREGDYKISAIRSLSLSISLALYSVVSLREGVKYASRTLSLIH